MHAGHSFSLRFSASSLCSVRCSAFPRRSCCLRRVTPLKRLLRRCLLSRRSHRLPRQGRVKRPGDAIGCVPSRQHRRDATPRARAAESGAGRVQVDRAKGEVQTAGRSRALATETAGELDVLGLDGDALGVDGGEVGVLEERDEVGLGRLCETSARRSGGEDGPWSAMTADDWKRRSVLKSWAISRTRRWNGSLRMRSSVDFW